MIPITVIAGPTASGKTRVALALAERTGAEIVSADSQQVYRDFDVGTAKPTAEELARVPHHLISVVDPRQRFSAGEYARAADAAIAAIAARGRRVLVVGGTGLYIRMLLHGMVEGPPADPALRAGLEARARRDGWESLHAELARVDPPSAAAIHVNDPVRIIRALELYQLTGLPASVHREQHRFEARRYDYQLYVLDPPRAELHAAIAQRTRAIFQAGLLDEVRALCAKGLRDAAPMGSVGYAQARAVVEGTLSLEQAEQEVAAATRQYAKRQRTWFKKEQGACWVAPPYAALQ